MIYLDNIASTRTDQRVTDAMMPYLKGEFGNSTSLHRKGTAVREAIAVARGQVSRLIGAQTDEIVFVSNSTEANNMAIKGLAEAGSGRGKHVVVSAIEHHSVLYAAKALERLGYEISLAPVNSEGTVCLDSVSNQLQDDTTVVSVMHASDEVGTVQDISQIGRLVRERGTVFHTDAVCTAGVLPFDVNTLSVDVATISSQHMLGPPGTAALYIRGGTRLRPLLDGGIQEQGRRGGQENVAAIVGFGVAADLAYSEMDNRRRTKKDLARKLLQLLKEQIPGLCVNGHMENRLPGHLSLTIPGADSESMVLLLDSENIAVSMGSSCGVHAAKTSHVLQAIGLTDREAQSTLLVTLGPSTSVEEIGRAANAIGQVVHRLRGVSGTVSASLEMSQ